MPALLQTDLEKNGLNLGMSERAGRGLFTTKSRTEGEEILLASTLLFSSKDKMLAYIDSLDGGAMLRPFCFEIPGLEHDGEPCDLQFGSR